MMSFTFCIPLFKVTCSTLPTLTLAENTVSTGGFAGGGVGVALGIGVGVGVGAGVGDGAVPGVV